MTIIVQAVILPRQWRGYDDPGLPVGMFIAQGIVTGDASGGRMAIQFLFRPEGIPVSGRFFNIEQMEATHTPPVADGAVDLNAAEFDLIGSTTLIDRFWRLEHRSNGVVGALTWERAPNLLPLFLGAPRRDAAFASQFNVGTLNTLNQTWSVTIQGYIWEPRSVMAEGGLRRPVDSLYGK